MLVQKFVKHYNIGKIFSSTIGYELTSKDCKKCK